MTDAPQVEQIKNFLDALVVQEKARTLVAPHAAQSGFWFGSGNMVQDESEALWLCGRYRNCGDSRTGLELGERGVSCNLFKSLDEGETWTQIKCWTKKDLSNVLGEEVLSIEGSLLNRFYCPKEEAYRWELFVSSEKDGSYPPPVDHYRKPGTGFWTIDRMISTEDSPETLDLKTLKRSLHTTDPSFLHVKDPALLFTADKSDHIKSDVLVFCTHPFSWTSCNTTIAVRDDPSQDFRIVEWEATHRGPCWDVGSNRVTGKLDLLEPWADYSVLFYDGAECVRLHPPNAKAVSRARGHSCEEVSGAYLSKKKEGSLLGQLKKLSVLESWFTSPFGTGCCRYFKVLKLNNGTVWITWQQGQEDGSQPLVGRRFSREEFEKIAAEHLPTRH